MILGVEFRYTLGFHIPQKSTKRLGTGKGNDVLSCRLVGRKGNNNTYIVKSKCHGQGVGVLFASGDVPANLGAGTTKLTPLHHRVS